MAGVRLRRQTNPDLFRRLTKHFGTDLAQLPVLVRQFETYERANLHLAIEEALADQSSKLIGVIVPEHYHSVTLARLSKKQSASNYAEGPVEFMDVALAGDQSLSCVKRGFYLFEHGERPLAMLLYEEQYTQTPGIEVEVMAPGKKEAEDFIARLTRLTKYGKALRGQVLSLEPGIYGGLSVRYHGLPQITREQIILPQPLLDRIDRHTIGFSRQAVRLVAAGRHLKREILLYGPPGTGKTLSAMYLASRMKGRTVLLLTGSGMGFIEKACTLARMLDPATIILEDVDLIGTERDRQMLGPNSLLLELLNQMDGLAEDSDVLFVLTTNRPDILEPALAARPGRIDLAIEMTLPDGECRRRLIELYGKGLELRISDRENLVKRIRGVSPAFIRELLRKAALLGAEDSSQQPIRITDAHIEEALAELLVAGGALTRTLLGVPGDGTPSRE